MLPSTFRVVLLWVVPRSDPSVVWPCCHRRLFLYGAAFLCLLEGGAAAPPFSSRCGIEFGEATGSD